MVLSGLIRQMLNSTRMGSHCQCVLLLLALSLYLPCQSFSSTLNFSPPSQELQKCQDTSSIPSLPSLLSLNQEKHSVIRQQRQIWPLQPIAVVLRAALYPNIIFIGCVSLPMIDIFITHGASFPFFHIFTALAIFHYLRVGKSSQIEVAVN